MKTLQECDYVTAANLLNCEVAAIKAVEEVESSGSGFLSTGEPRILFEGHVFYRLTKGKFGVSNVSYPSWISKYYNENQHLRLAKAITLNREAALQSASWGKFQIMGENWKSLGYSSLQEFINAMYANETEHLMAFVKFVKVNGLADELKRKDWAGFARGYNGPGYAKNQYDKKMAAAYLKFSRK
ncbi:N-acetylmuramidase family protein [Kaistella sp. 97-N-M2]|uniref:N-acetylmuramidase family protein n=1 Tax=Kaistella sp. 97-N-M2 TaxID=2908645 RepID=UPI001F2DBD81|nr:N-acetylmuramidase family protein [Kaistella sp. 97-N-M2]UJF29887.1 N-acetylmuramidase family protein [Kaistella sp. 97-N-M2]